MNHPLKIFGGKSYLAKRIIAMTPKHLHYVEPFFGGGAVLLEKNPEGVSEVVNDINGELTNFWRCLKYDTYFKYFQRCVEAIPFSQVEWERVCGILEADNIRHAVAFFVRCRQSRAGQFKEFATITRNRVRRGMNEQVSAWLSAIEGLPEVHARLKRVVILNQEATEVIKKQDGVNTLHYLDPPYVHETRASKDVYNYEMTTAQHSVLLETLSGIKGKFLLSGYHSTLYDNYAREYGWSCTEFDLPNNAAGGKSKRRMTECVWSNYEPN